MSQFICSIRIQLEIPYLQCSLRQPPNGLRMTPWPVLQPVIPLLLTFPIPPTTDPASFIERTTVIVNVIHVVYLGTFVVFLWWLVMMGLDIWSQQGTVGNLYRFVVMRRICKASEVGVVRVDCQLLGTLFSSVPRRSRRSRQRTVLLRGQVTVLVERCISSAVYSCMTGEIYVGEQGVCKWIHDIWARETIASLI